MTNYDNSIRLLSQHLDKLGKYNTVFEAWLDTAIELLHDICGPSSNQYWNFINIRSEYNVQKIFDKSPALVSKAQGRIRQQLTDIINQLIEKKNVEIANREKEKLLKEQAIKLQVEKKESIKSIPAIPLATPIQAGSPISENATKTAEMNPSEKKHYSIGIGLFWSIALPVAAGIFFFGLYVGTAKFDQTKIDLFLENGELKNINKSLSEEKKSDSTKMTLQISTLKKQTILHVDSLQK